MSLPAVVANAVSVSARRAVILLTGLALALAAMATPQFTNAANAATAHHLSARMTAAYARAMLNSLNVERRWNHEAPLRMNTKLIKSAHAHNLAMARANTMSHQLPGEAFFADRISRAGYNWESAGENIGWNSDLSQTGIYYLERVMYHEKAPNDGHRQNILSRSYINVGIDVYYDAAHNKVWFTQDFGQPMS
jgi:uncharacterized protein YkwD